MAVIKSLFGKSAEGKEISLYTLSNDQGMKAEITDLGCYSGARTGTGCHGQGGRPGAGI